MGDALTVVELTARQLLMTGQYRSMAMLAQDPLTTENMEFAAKTNGKLVEIAREMNSIAQIREAIEPEAKKHAGTPWCHACWLRDRVFVPEELGGPDPRDVIFV